MTRTHGPAQAAQLPSGIIRRPVLLSAAIAALGGLLFGAPAYFRRQVPETKNRNLHDIERDLDRPGRPDGRHRERGRVSGLRGT